MKTDVKENYMKSILGEAEYEANLEDWKEEGLEDILRKLKELGVDEKTLSLVYPHPEPVHQEAPSKE